MKIGVCKYLFIGKYKGDSSLAKKFTYYTWSSLYNMMMMATIRRKSSKNLPRLSYEVRE